jgi:thioredoxin reductase (NADPH)
MDFKPWEQQWDTVIIGGGPGGVAAAIYAIRGEMKTLLIEKSFIGGQIALTAEVENYPGVPHTTGMEMAQNMEAHLRKFNTPIINKTVERILEAPGSGYMVELSGGEMIETKTVIISTGSRPNLLEAKHAKEFYGHGVSYCAICDGPFFRGEDVIIVGGGDAAMEEAQYLASVCKHVTLIHRREGFRAQPIAVNRTKAVPNITMRLNAVVTEIIGADNKITGVRIRDTKTGEESDMPAAAVFVFIGSIPNSQFARGFIAMSDDGQIYIDERMRTSRPGIFAVGDVTHNSLKQMSISVGEGASAALMARHYITTGEWLDEPPGPVHG